MDLTDLGSWLESLSVTELTALRESLLLSSSSCELATSNSQPTHETGSQPTSDGVH